MLRLSFRTEPFWLDLPHGVRVQVRPPGTAVILAAGSEMASSAADSSANEPDTDTLTGPPAANPAVSSRLAFACAVARAAILDWEGVADAEGALLPVSPATVDALMAHWPVFAAFERLYLQPALLVVAEGNG